MTSHINVTSEIGKLEAVLLHRPGLELERLTPANLTISLFDDIPWVQQMKVEHDAFADVLREHGSEVIYVLDLLQDILLNETVKRQLLDDVLANSSIHSPYLEALLHEFLRDQTPQKLSEYLIAGLHKSEINHIKRKFTLSDYVKSAEPYLLNPLPNLYFMRDPAVVIGKTISISTMFSQARFRESILMQHIYQTHPLFTHKELPNVHHFRNDCSIEGGDILILSPSVIAVGCSQRTSPAAIEDLARKSFVVNSDLQEVLVVDIPNARSFMHLDTVFTMIDYDKFTVYPGIEPLIHLYSITRGPNQTLNCRSLTDSLRVSLEKSLGIDHITFIRSGGGNPITAAREQWNDSTNTLAIAPGVVVTYQRNQASNHVLQQNGLKVIAIADSELIRGRGGPRCMSMPLRRANINL